MEPERGSFNAWRPTLFAAAGGLVLTLLVSWSGVEAAARSVPTKIALDTLEACIALLAAFLIWGRQRQHRSASGSALIFALLLFAAANILWSVVPKILEVDDPTINAWVPLVLRVIGAAAMVAGAWIPEHADQGKRGTERPVIAAAGVIAAGAIASVVLADALPAPLPEVDRAMFARPDIVGSPVLIASQAIAALLFTAACIGFARKAGSESDPFLRWVAAGAALGAVARLNYFLFPSLYTEYVYSGDLLRLGFYLFVLTASVSQMVDTWQRLESQALVDPLTGLSNRHGFEVLSDFRIAQARRLKQPLALVFIDLDDMKGINDTHGHDAGDRALTDVAALIRQTFRDIDVMARLGGDEFCVLLSDGADATHASTRLEENLEAFRTREARPYALSLSCGVATTPPEGTVDLPDLIARADAAMYEQKATHRIKSAEA